MFPLLSSLQGMSTCDVPEAGWGWDATASCGRARKRRPTSAVCPLTPSSLCPDITGPIILQTYRAIADYEKSSGSEMALAMGDVVDVVEKSESGQPPALPGPSSPVAWANGHSPHQGSASQAASSLLPTWPTWALTVLPTLWVTLFLSVYPVAAVGVCIYCVPHCAPLGIKFKRGGQMPRHMCEMGSELLFCDRVCVWVCVILMWSMVKVIFLNLSVGCLWVCVQVSSPPDG